MDIANYLNEHKDEYVFCGIVKFKDMCCYVGSYKIKQSTLDEFAEDEDFTLSDFLPLLKWSPTDYANGIDGELENKNYHSYQPTPHDVIDALPDKLNDEEKIEILKKLFSFIIY